MNGMFVTVDGVVGSEVRQTEWNGTALAGFRFVVKERRFDRATQQWTTAHESWMTVNCFRDLAANAAASIAKGDRLIVHGRLRVKQYVNADGEPRIAVDLDADALGHDLRYGSTVFTAAREGGDGALRERVDRMTRELHESLMADQAGRPADRPVRDPDDEDDDGYDSEEDLAEDAAGLVAR